jgi:DNA-binding CsgD family transcriptional regulator
MTEIEFFISADQKELMVQQYGQSKPLTENDTELITFIYQQILENYPDAFHALNSIYGHAAHFKYLSVRRFGKCNFGIYDNRQDIKSDGLFNLEFVHCPLRGECKWENTICLPKFSTTLSDREMQVLKLICDNLEDIQIADKLFISVFTVNNHRRSIERKLCVNNKLGILKYAKDNSLI